MPDQPGSLDSVKREVNEYLAVEWGHDGQVDEDNPVRLHHLGSADVDTTSCEVFEFVDDGERFFAYAGQRMGYVPAGEMTLQDLWTQEAGRAWLGRREPVDLGTSRIGDQRVPPAVERRDAIRTLIKTAGHDPERTTILEGLFLIADGRYVALVESADRDRSAVVEGVVRPVAAVMRGTSTWQQLSHSVGAYLTESGSHAPTHR